MCVKKILKANTKNIRYNIWYKETDCNDSDKIPINLIGD